MPLVQVFKGKWLIAFNGFTLGKQVQHVGTLVQLDVGNGYNGNALGHGRHVILNVLYHQCAQGIIFRRVPTSLADGCIVVVRGEVGL